LDRRRLQQKLEALHRRIADYREHLPEGQEYAERIARRWAEGDDLPLAAPGRGRGSQAAGTGVRGLPRYPVVRPAKPARTSPRQ
jgi:hypothetical protein